MVIMERVSVINDDWADKKITFGEFWKKLLNSLAQTFVEFFSLDFFTG